MKKWFENLRIAYKLLFSFLSMTLLVIIIGVIGIVNLSILADHQQQLYAIYQSTTAEVQPNSDSTTSATSDGTSSATVTTQYVDNDSNKSKVAIFTMIGIVIISVIISVLLGTHMSRLIGHPMRLFADFAKMLAVGDVEVEKNITQKDRQIMSRTDEIGVLSNSFSRVIESTYEQATATQRIADGDLTTEIEIRSENDTMGKALSELVDKYHTLVFSILSTAEQVSSGANLVSDSSMLLSQGTTEQASAIQELTATLAEIASQTNLNSLNADKAAELTEAAKMNADSGSARMDEMLTAMDDINISSGEINKIIKVIDDIAFQTNILALNAAVEAARAGQHGKGFAVVAEEVRNLAARSASATKETAEMIQISLRKVQTGSKIAKETAEALSQIIHYVGAAAEVVREIAEASKTQASNIAQINQAITQVSEVVQTNAANSEESAAASEELSSQAAQLLKAVSIFKLQDSPYKINDAERMYVEDHLLPEDMGIGNHAYAKIL